MAPPLDRNFEAFPPAVQRKYFSTLERLRLAQSPGFSTAPRSQSYDPIVKRSKKDFVPFRCQRPSTAKNLAGPPSKPPSSIDFYSWPDAQWFMNLPDKAQNIHFSKEEQLLLTGHCHSVIPDAADVVFYNFGHQRNQSIPSLRTLSDSSLSSIDSLEEDFLIDADSDMDDPTLDSFRWMEDEDELDLSLDDYHTHISSTVQFAKKSSSRRPSFRRSLSLTTIPFGATKFSSTNKISQKQKPIELPPTLPLLSHQSKNSHQGTSRLRCPIQRPVSPAESSTKYYQDPEARLKLRVYLASPQKFDEAIEFGFPSLEDKENMPPRRPSLSKHHYTDSILQTFFNDDNPSIFNALDDDDDPSSPETDHPKTPPSSAFHYPYRLPPSKSTSLDSDNSRGISEPYGNVLGGTREMTLRMTLTRPDLRKTGPPPYSDEDPLALQHLPPMKDPGDIWEIQSKDGIVKKLWHKMSRRTPMA